MENEKTMNFKNLAWKSFLVLSVPLALAPMVLCVVGNPLTCDESYYLSIMERMVEGKRLYHEVNTGYSPLWFCLMAGLKLLFHIPSGCAEPYYVLHFLMQITASYFLFRIIVLQGIDKKIAFFCSWLFVMMGHWMQGNLLNLEMSSLMFGLLSLWIVMAGGNDKSPWRAFVGGLASSCAFLCKQYGFGFFLLAVVWIVFAHGEAKNGNARNRLVVLGMFVLGFIVPIVLSWIIWGRNLFESTLANGYGTKIAKTYNKSTDVKVGWILQAYKVLCTRVAVVLPLSLLFLPRCIREKRGFVVCFAWLGVFGFMLQYYFAYEASHYMLYVLPFVMIIIAVVMSLLSGTNKWLGIVFLVALGITVGYSCYADYHNRVWKLYLHHYKQKEIDLAEKVKELVPQGSTLWIPNSGIYFVHFYANTVPPNLSTIAYSFGDDGLTIENAVKQAESADYVLSFDWEGAEPYYTKELKKFIYSHEEVYVDTIWDAVLHDMSKLKEE